MPDAKIQVLMAGPQLPSLANPVEQQYTTHKLWLAEDRAAFLAEHGPHIRAIVTNAPVGANAELMAALPNLEVICSSGVGLDAIDLKEAQKRGVSVTHTPAVLNECVADTGLALMLALVRRICEADRFVRAGEWPKQRFPLARSLAGKTCGILGLGGIGLAVAKRAEAFGMKIAYSNRRPRTDLNYDFYSTPVALAQAADVLILTLPGGPETHHVVNAELLEALGPQGYLVNIARDSVVDEQALICALQEGKIAGAALDVFEEEPKVPEALFKLDNVVLTPHLASGTEETRNAMSALTFANLEAHFAGKPLLSPAF